jgi:hypothetical protein
MSRCYNDSVEGNYVDMGGWVVETTSLVLPPSHILEDVLKSLAATNAKAKHENVHQRLEIEMY